MYVFLLVYNIPYFLPAKTIIHVFQFKARRNEDASAEDISERDESNRVEEE